MSSPPGRWRLLLALLLAPLPTLAAQGTPPIRLQVERYRLPNGLRVILAPDSALVMASVQIWYGVGSRDEPPGRMGFAHLFEHVMFTGSAHAPAGTHDRFIRGAGGWSNGFTTHDATGYFETFAANHLERILWLEADRMGFLLPVLDSARFLAQRDVVKNERRMTTEVPYGRMNEILLWTMFPPPHPHGWWPIGYMPDLDAARLDDIRDFFRTWYGPANATLVVAGGFEPAAARAAIARWFGGLRGAKPPARVAVPPSPLRGERVLVLEESVKRSQLSIRWPTVGLGSPDDATLALLAAVLSQTKYSRLDQSLVQDRRIANWVNASQLGYERVGDFRINVQAAEGHTLTEVADEIDSILARLRREGPTPAEMRMARSILSQNWVNGLEGADGRAQVLIQGDVQAHDPRYYLNYLARLQRTTAAQVRAAAVRYLGRDRVLLSVVPEGQRAQAAHPERAQRVAPATNGVGYTFEEVR